MRTDSLVDLVGLTEPITLYGKVRDVVGLVIESAGPSEVALGELCMIGDPQGEHIAAEVIGFRGERVLLMPLSEIEGIRPGTDVFPTRSSLRIPVGNALQGRILDALGNRRIIGMARVPSTPWNTDRSTAVLRIRCGACASPNPWARACAPSMVWPP